MTEHIKIGDITPRIHYEANGSQTEFTYPFPIFENDNLKVYLGETLQTTGYSVSGAGNSNGGSVTFDTAPANEVFVTIERSLTIIRQSDFQAGGAFRASVINDELDFQTAALQEVATNQNRSIYLPPMDASADLKLPVASSRANRALAFDADGDVIAGPLVDNVIYAEEYATNAAASATAAALSETNAGTSEDNAATSATNAATSASAVELPDPAVASTYIKRNAGNTAYEAKTPTEVAADVASNFAANSINSDAIDGGGGGVWTLLETIVANDTTYIDFTTIDDSYSSYILVFSKIKTTTTTRELRLRFFDNNVLDTGTSNYAYNLWRTYSTSLNINHDSSESYIQLIQYLYYDGTASGSIELRHLNQSGEQPQINSSSVAQQAGTLAQQRCAGASMAYGITKMDGIRLYMDTGVMASGTFKLYGIE